jgi:type II secretory pathway pseudopilin PulG
MRHAVRRSRTFTLVELMITITIAMVLAALTLPVLNEAILRSKRAEAATNIDGIDFALVGYITAEGDPPPDPVGLTYPLSSSLGRGSQVWVPTPSEWPLEDAWAPSGDVRCGYHHEVLSSTVGVYAVCDVNDTDRFYVEARTIPLEGVSTTASATYCCTALYGACIPSNDCY